MRRRNDKSYGFAKRVQLADQDENENDVIDETMVFKVDEEPGKNLQSNSTWNDLSMGKDVGRGFSGFRLLQRLYSGIQFLQ